MSRLHTLWAVWPLLVALPAAAANRPLTIDFEAASEGPISTANYAVAGVSFENAYLFIDADSPGAGGAPRGSGDFGRAPSKYGAMTMFRPAGSAAGATLTFADGIGKSISFWYSTVFAPMTVQVLDAQGAILAQSGVNGPALGALGSDAVPFRGPFGEREMGSYNRWQRYTLDFAGVGHAIVFNGNVLDPGPTGMVLGDFFVDNLVVTTVPEAPTAALMLAGAGALAWRRRRR